MRLYSQSRLTKQDDRLIALSGVGQRLQSILQDEYLAGIWRQQLPQNLIWKPVTVGDPCFRVPNRGPSWSWASIEGPIYLPFQRGRGEDLISIIEAQTIPVQSEDYFGEVKSGTLHVKGRLFAMEAYQLSTESDFTRWGKIMVVCRDQDANHKPIAGAVPIYFSADDTKQLDEDGLYFLPVFTWSPKREVDGIVLQVTDTKGERWFSRWGYAAWKAHYASGFAADFGSVDFQKLLENTAETTITII